MHEFFVSLRGTTVATRFRSGRLIGRFGGQFSDGYGFVHRVGSVADSAQAVEGGNAQAGGEIAVGTTAYGGFGERPAELAGDRAALLYNMATPGVRSMGGRLTPPVISNLHFRLRGGATAIFCR